MTVLHVFFLAMVVSPEAQRKAQKELDEVVGPTRFPDFEDRPNLPYINALCKEVMRWHPIIPVGLAHSVTQDDVFGGYLIPKGSLVLGNTWYSVIWPSQLLQLILQNRHMLHDETVYGPETDKFLPERFLNPGIDPTIAFGFGRR